MLHDYLAWASAPGWSLPPDGHGKWVNSAESAKARHQPPAGCARNQLASLHGKEAALVCTSGFVSDKEAISTIAKMLPDCVGLSDGLNHISMI